MDPTPLSPVEVDALLSDPRSRAADMLVLRDALDRMAGALERLADAVGRLEDVSEQLRPVADDHEAGEGDDGDDGEGYYPGPRPRAD